MSRSSNGLPLPNFDFEICRLKLGTGGSGSVFLAQHRQTKELVAVKRFFWSPAVDISKGSPSQHRLPSEPQTPVRDPAHMRTFSLPASEETQRYPIGDNFSQDCYDHRQSNSSMEDIVLGDRPLNVPLKHTCRPPRPPCESTILQFLGPHQHIVKFLGNYTTPNRITYLAMELMDSDLGRELRADNTSFIDENVMRCLLHGVVSAVDHLHRRGIAHCDIKPSNILLKRVPATMTLDTGNRYCSTATALPTGHGRSCEQSKGEHVHVFLGDFSSALFNYEGGRRNSVGGTLYYKAPEQLMGQAVDLFACDMWALGCTIFELITGSVAFCGSTDLQVLHQIYTKLGTDYYNFPSRIRASTLFDCLCSPSPDLLQLLKGLLALNPRERLSAKELFQQSFFKPLQRVLDCRHTALAIPLQLRGGRTVDACQFTFRSIVRTTPPTRAREAVADATASSAHHCSVWSLSSISATQSPATLRRRGSLAGPPGARARDGGSGGSAQGKEGTPPTVGRAFSLDAVSATPVAAVRGFGVAEALSSARQPKLQPTGGITLGNLRTNMVFERSCGALHEGRTLFSDEGESPSRIVRKNLFESPCSLKRPHPDDMTEKNFREEHEYETTASNCSTPRMMYTAHDAGVPLREFFRSFHET